MKELYDRVAMASKQMFVREHIVGHHIGHSKESLDILGNTGMYLSFKTLVCSYIASVS